MTVRLLLFCLITRHLLDLYAISFPRGTFFKLVYLCLAKLLILSRMVTGCGLKLGGLTFLFSFCCLILLFSMIDKIKLYRRT